jgi:hypothetical protein
MRQCIDKASGNRIATESEDDWDRFDLFSNDSYRGPGETITETIFAQQLIDKTW